MRNPDPNKEEIILPSVDILKQSVSGCLKAVARRGDLEVEFSGDQVRHSQDFVVLPEPGPFPDKNERTVLRGEADSVALWLSQHDDAIQNAHQPEDPAARSLFQRLERLRVEALGANAYSGMALNLSSALYARLSKPDLFSAPQEAHDKPNLDRALLLLLWEQMTGLSLPSSVDAMISPLRTKFGGEAGILLDKLAKSRMSQKEYALIARDVLKWFHYIPDDEEASDREADDSAAPPQQSSSEDTDSETESKQDKAQKDDQENEGASSGEDLSEDFPPDDEISDEVEGNDSRIKGGQTPFTDFFTENAIPYKVFTTRFDEIINPADIVPGEELARLRALLDKELVQFQKIIARLANRLQRRLLAQQNRDWEFDCEEGMLDPARITRIITDPFAALSFKQELDTDFRDTVVSLLIDNSGSMRGRQIAIAAICADILARTLERCGIKVEILGFTTRNWKGGDSKKLWMQSGKPENPGRLNDLRHIIYKSADIPWRRAKNNMGLMLRDNLLKENIDGEALQWAFQRLALRFEQRKILMVISDGAPVDDTTTSVNTATYLEQHLRAVVEEIEYRSSVDLVAIGIGYDVSRFYKRAVTIHNVEELGGVMMDKLMELFDEKAASRNIPGKGKKRIARVRSH